MSVASSSTSSKPRRLPTEGQHFAVQVADIQGAVTELRGRGIQVSDPSPVARGLQAFLVDPDGNAIELHQVPA